MGTNIIAICVILIIVVIVVAVTIIYRRRNNKNTDASTKPGADNGVPIPQAKVYKWKITKAMWGPLGAQVDVTKRAQELLGDTGRVFKEPHVLFGDNSAGNIKTFSVEYVDDVGIARRYAYTEGAFPWPANGIQL